MADVYDPLPGAPPPSDSASPRIPRTIGFAVLALLGAGGGASIGGCGVAVVTAAVLFWGG